MAEHLTGPGMQPSQPESRPSGAVYHQRSGHVTDIPTGRADACPDPETLAAYVDGMLDPAARAGVEAHAADCRDCREILADTAAFLLDVGQAVPAREPDPERGPVAEPAPPGEGPPVPWALAGCARCGARRRGRGAARRTDAAVVAPGVGAGHGTPDRRTRPAAESANRGPAVPAPGLSPATRGHAGDARPRHPARPADSRVRARNRRVRHVGRSTGCPRHRRCRHGRRRRGRHSPGRSRASRRLTTPDCSTISRWPI